MNKKLLFLRRYLSEYVSDFFSFLYPQQTFAFAGVGGMAGLHFTEGDDNGGGGGGNDGGDEGEKDQKGEKTYEPVPYERFKEVNDKKKEAEEKLAKYEKEKADDEALKKKQEDEEALKRGEHEKIIAEKDSALSSYKEKEGLRSEREKSMTAQNEAKIEALKKSAGEEKRKQAQTLIEGITDPFTLAVKLQSLEGFLGDTKQSNSGGSGLPEGNGSAIDEIKAKLEKGQVLTNKERDVYFQYTSTLKK